METKTYNQLVDEILYEIYGGLPPSDKALSERFILTKVNDAIALVATMDAFQTNGLEGVTYADDTFYVSFSNLPLQDDAITGYKTVTMPATPIGLPRGRGIEVMPTGAGAGSNSRAVMFNKIPRHELHRILSLPPIKKILYYQEGQKLFFIFNKFFKHTIIPSINLSMQCTGGEMSDIVNAPRGVIDRIKKSVIADLKPTLVMPKDIRNDGRQILEPRP